MCVRDRERERDGGIVCVCVIEREKENTSFLGQLNIPERKNKYKQISKYIYLFIKIHLERGNPPLTINYN